MSRCGLFITHEFGWKLICSLRPTRSTTYCIGHLLYGRSCVSRSFALYDDHKYEEMWGSTVLSSLLKFWMVPVSNKMLWTVFQQSAVLSKDILLRYNALTVVINQLEKKNITFRLEEKLRLSAELKTQAQKLNEEYKILNQKTWVFINGVY